MLSEEQTSALKKQLIEHIDKSFPDDKKGFAIEQVENMSPKELEEFLAKNNLVAGQNSQCVFCSIVFGDIPSYKIGENADAIAVLEINPISRGHSLIIPKKHLSEKAAISDDIEKLVKIVSGRIKTKLKPKRIETIASSMFGHHVINILPVYTDETFDSKRQPAKKEELEEIEKLLKVKPKTQISKPKTPRQKKSKLKEVVEKFEKKLWLPQRIP